MAPQPPPLLLTLTIHLARSASRPVQNSQPSTSLTAPTRTTAHPSSYPTTRVLCQSGVAGTTPLNSSSTGDGASIHPSLARTVPRTSSSRIQDCYLLVCHRTMAAPKRVMASLHPLQKRSKPARTRAITAPTSRHNRICTPTHCRTRRYPNTPVRTQILSTPPTPPATQPTTRSAFYLTRLRSRLARQRSRAIRAASTIGNRG